MSKEAMKLALEVMRNQGDVSVDEWIAVEKTLREALTEKPAKHLPDKLVYDGYESPQYIEGWNDCIEFMKGMK